MAGMAGLEPTNARVKVWCLTTWRHPNIDTATGDLKRNGVDEGIRTLGLQSHNLTP